MRKKRREMADYQSRIDECGKFIATLETDAADAFLRHRDEVARAIRDMVLIVEERRRVLRDALRTLEYDEAANG